MLKGVKSDGLVGNTKNCLAWMDVYRGAKNLEIRHMLVLRL